MARSMEWWVLATAAAAVAVAALALACAHASAGMPARDDPISQALVGA